MSMGTLTKLWGLFYSGLLTTFLYYQAVEKPLGFTLKRKLLLIPPNHNHNHMYI